MYFQLGRIAVYMYAHNYILLYIENVRKSFGAGMRVVVKSFKSVKM